MHNGSEQEVLQLHICVVRAEAQVLRVSPLPQEEWRASRMFLYKRVREDI